MKTDVKILAHRGGMGRAPENTIAAFQQTLDDGADAFECDVCLTRDEEPVLIHTKFDDGDIKPVTGCTTPLRQLDWTDVRRLNVLNSSQPVAHLDQMLSFVEESGLPCFLEPKSGSERLITLVVDRIRRFNLEEKVSVLTFYLHREILTHVKRIAPNINTSAIIINPMADFLSAARAINADRIIIGWSGLNHFAIYNSLVQSLPRKVRQLKAAGVSIEGGFVQNRRDVEWTLKNGIRRLWTDDVPETRAYVQDINI
ncbi:MAG: glycerophosphodiester phosphodiesterase [Candidatus Poribacteria bacterium]|nr:glycerophosphodiester phosphodiesterase [Candidatus Poribacteria bacterium]MDE0505369.1 glycerophosphodiester phosphodiesterase [Candidatus Poribacteria bacterium]